MLTDWIKNIIFVVLFASFLELLLPSSNMRRFVRVIMGLFIMLAILNPIIGTVQHLTSKDQVPAFAANLRDLNVIENEANHVTKDHNALSLELYKKELSQQIRILVMAVDGVADANVVVEIKKGNASTAIGINSIIVYVKPGISAKGEKIVSIAKVKIDKEVNKSEETHNDLKQRIADIILELYQIPKEKVDIKMLYS
ncbi:stage III sporulation protein AF [Pelosinus propionicus]|nr:stage III sporulation protein AF [Pelosinus propionicus]